LKVIDLFFLLPAAILLPASSSAIPNIEIRRLWAVLNSVRF
jgi:hypothetical protein